MQDDQIQSALQDIFRSVFADPSLVIGRDMQARDVARWDSISHYDMLASVEDRFHLTFSTRDVANLRNVGDLIALIERKLNV